MDDVELDAVADRLYGLPPEDFIAARDAAARQAADAPQRKAVKALRRPSVSAWVVNVLAREQAGLLQQLLDLGAALADAQRSGQGEALRSLGKQRRELVGAITATAAELADRPVSAQVRAEVEQTLEAALADPRAADAVRSGRLVRPLSYAGLGDVDLDDAVAVQPATEHPPKRPTKGTSTQDQPAPRAPSVDLDALERAALDAAAALDDAVRACEQADRRAARAGQQGDDARQAADRAAQEVQRLEELLTAARDAAQQAASDADQAAATADRSAAEAAQHREQVGAAQDAAERARAALDRARRGG